MMKNRLDYAVMAASVVEHLLPPKSVEEIYRVVAALNLLNAIVKLPYGHEMTSYNYIKGMTACLFLRLLYFPVEGVDIYWEKGEDVVYFRVKGRQFSFHHVPLMATYEREMGRRALKEQLWDGKRLQLVAIQLFDEACKVKPLSGDERVRLLNTMHDFGMEELRRRVKDRCGVKLPVGSARRWLRQKPGEPAVTVHVPRPRIGQRPYRGVRCTGHDIDDDSREDKILKLELALRFSGFWEKDYVLTRRGDHWKAKIACYTGTNYEEVVQKLVGNRPMTHVKPEHTMRPGQRYFIHRPSYTWRRLSYGRYLLLVAHYNYLTVGDRHYNLCITYGLARYLGCLYPGLQFLNVLNYTRFKVHRHIYTYRDLLRVPMRSKARTLKVWMVVDKYLALTDLNIESLPAALKDEFYTAEDYWQFFQLEYHNGNVGLVAYSRFHLLPAIYAKIDIYGHYARVMNHERKWAVYSLMQEEFETEFVFDSIWTDYHRSAILGRCGERVVVIHDLYASVKV